jgi:hypothetical protein
MPSFSLEEIKNIITILALIAAGIWTFYRFGINRERHPKLQFDLDLEILGKTDRHYIVQLIAIVENKGLTRQYIHDFKFNLLYFNNKFPIDCEDVDINYQLKFKNFINARDWLRPRNAPFVDGTITHRFTYNTVIPTEAEYLMIYSKFRDPRRGLFRKTSDKYHISKTFDLKRLYKE